MTETTTDAAHAFDILYRALLHDWPDSDDEGGCYTDTAAHDLAMAICARYNDAELEHAFLVVGHVVNRMASIEHAEMRRLVFDATPGATP